MKCPYCLSEYYAIRTDLLQARLEAATALLRRHAKQIDLSSLLEADIPDVNDCAVVYKGAHGQT